MAMPLFKAYAILLFCGIHGDDCTLYCFSGRGGHYFFHVRTLSQMAFVPPPEPEPAHAWEPPRLDSDCPVAMPKNPRNVWP